MARELAVEALAGDWRMERQSARLLVSQAHAHGSAEDSGHNARVIYGPAGFEVTDTPSVR